MKTTRLMKSTVVNLDASTCLPYGWWQEAEMEAERALWPHLGKQNPTCHSPLRRTTKLQNSITHRPISSIPRPGFWFSIQPYFSFLSVSPANFPACQRPPLKIL